MQKRQHYMKPGMLQSQFDTLEEPKGAGGRHQSCPDKIVRDIMEKLMDKNILWQFLEWESWGAAWRRTSSATATR